MRILVVLNEFYIEEHIKKALIEDIGFGDITTESLTGESTHLRAALNTREDGILAGADVFNKVFKILSNDVKIQFNFKDGYIIKKGDKLADIVGPARAILSGERVALNYIQRMSGIATETNRYRMAIDELPTKIVDTRKTTPNFRAFEKYSVLMGGGSLHRFNLSDCAMIKDNHIKLAGSITNAVNQIKREISHAHKIEVECDTIDQVKEALECNVEIIMLDNMSPELMKEAVKLIDHRAIVEASGNVSLNTVRNIALTGVDIISSSAIVAKAPTLDIALDIE